MKNQNKHLKYISHGIYLQIFIGLGFFLPALLDVALPEFMASPKTFGGMLVMLGINSLIYINKYIVTIEK